MADIQYLNYGDQQIEQQALLNNLANDVQNYVQNQPWSRKRKEKFMSAYSDLMNRGIIGASNNSGQWMLDVNGPDIQFDTMDKKDKEMYQEAAYYIRQQMSKLPTRTSQEQQQQKELPTFEFNNSFKAHVNKTFNGGQPLQIGGSSDQWNYLDERDPNTGIRGRKNRADKLAGLLKSYRKELGDGSKYNFEGSPYKDITDFDSRLNKAITALETYDNPNDDREALQAIGLNSADWLNDGSGDTTTYNGQQVTYGQLNQLKQAEEKAKKEELEKNRLHLSISPIAMNGQDLIALGKKYNGNTNALLSKMNEYSQRGLENLSGEELSELVGTFKYGHRTSIDEDLFNRIKSSSQMFKNSKIQDFQKVNGIEGAVWHVPTGRLIGYQTAEQQQMAANQFNDFLKGYSAEEQDLLRRANAGKRQMFTPTFNEDGSIDWINTAKNGGIDGARLSALVEDIGAGVAAFIPMYGTAISAGLSLDALKQELLADVADPSVSWGEVGTNVILNAAFTALGLFPGGKLFRAGKWGRTLARMAPSLIGIGISSGAFASLMEDESFRQSWGKIADGKVTDLTVEDGKNIIKGVSSVVGILQGGVGTYNAYKYRNAGKQAATKVKTQTVKTNKGEIPVNDEQVKGLNEAVQKGGKDEANKYLNKEVKNDENAGLVLEQELPSATSAKIRSHAFNPLRGITKPTVKVQRTYETPSLSTSVQQNLARLQQQNLDAKAGKGTYRYIPKWVRENVPTDYDLLTKKLGTSRTDSSTEPNSSFFPNKNIGKNEITPLKPYNPIDIRKPVYENKNLDPFSAEAKAYRDILKGHFSKNPLQDNKSITIGDYIFQVTKQKDGTWSIQATNKSMTDNHVQHNLKSQKEIQEYMSKVVQQIRKNNSSSKSGNRMSMENVGKLLKEFKAKGWLKQGGRIDKQRIQRYKNFINK